MNKNCQKGSALLIVLGMLAFMVVSAVAFSAYMRATRLPSSFLRRTVSSRQLVKAALAEAIEEVDAAIGNCPHPGVNTGNNATDISYLPRSDEMDYSIQAYRNQWIGRVYIGQTNRIGQAANKPTDNRKCLESQRDTVSTLTLEALAYIPPSLVNEARYYSRRSTAALWHTMPFDSGRYAFTAIDVSDYFDINSVCANVPRSSAAGTRISLAYLFENVDHDNAASDASLRSWDENLIRPCLQANMPLTSIADWNLAVGSQTYGNGGEIKSYFYNYIKSGASDFYNGELKESGDESHDKIGKMTFVTDGWMPAPETNGDELDLDNAKNQPFTKDLIEKQSSYLDVTDFQSDLILRLIGLNGKEKRRRVPNIAIAALYDYLDSDSRPISLAVPTLERTPMFCGVTPNCGSAKLAIKQEVEKQADGSEVAYTPSEAGVKGEDGKYTRTAIKSYKYTLNTDELALDGYSMSSLAVYPFRNNDASQKTFTPEARMALFMTSADMALRPSAAVDALRFYANNNLTKPKLENGVLLSPMAGSGTLNAWKVLKEDEAVKDSITFNSNSQAGSMKNEMDANPFLTVTYQWTQTRGVDAEGNPTGEWLPESPDMQKDIFSCHCAMPPLLANGTVDGDFSDDAKLKSILQGDGKALKLNLAVWVALKDKDGKYIDLVPACATDDKANNDVDDAVFPIILDNFGQQTPLMRFDLGSFSTKITDLAGVNVPLTVSPKSVYVRDPRFNYAPESWCYSDSEVTKDNWLNLCDAHNTTRDGDIFMQTSDQEYMQSIYELGNLLRYSNDGFANAGNADIGSLSVPKGTTQNNNTFAQGGSEVNNEFMWKTYDPFGHYRGGGDDFEGLDVVNNGLGFKINPYSDSTNVIMAAFANTPLDWRFASTNEEAQTDAGINIPSSVKTFNTDYAWSAYSSVGKIAWADLEDVARAFMEDMRANPTKDWEDVFADLGWAYGSTDASKKILADLPDLEYGNQDAGRVYCCDKKFLYGYWHDCFAVRQQLFLIFVRAEPSMLGGGVAGAAPPQLGARAVALVWRDPTPTNLQNNKPMPHRTRILFYHQLD